MSLFLLTYFLLYGGVHGYFFHKARQAVGFGSVTATALAAFMVLMLMAPVLVRLAERHDQETAAQILAYIGYTWMGLLFLYFSAAVVIDLYHAIVWLTGRFWGGSLPLTPIPAGAAFWVPVALACLVSFYGAFEARHIRTERRTLVTDKLPPGTDRFTIVQVSDVHLGLIVREARVSRIIDCIRKTKPDVLVSTGDFVDGQIDGLSSIARMFRDIHPPCGKYAVTGNHEFYAGLHSSLGITEEAGFHVLRGDVADVGGIITVVGVDDPTAHQFSPQWQDREHGILAAAPRSRFILLLKHRPKVNRDSSGLFDLQLSGHVHKGQIFPFNLLTHLFYPVKMGLSFLPSGSALYVSRGTGTWGPPIRFLAPPEVTVIELVRAATQP